MPDTYAAAVARTEEVGSLRDDAGAGRPVAHRERLLGRVLAGEPLAVLPRSPGS